MPSRPLAPVWVGVAAVFPGENLMKPSLALMGTPGGAAAEDPQTQRVLRALKESADGWPMATVIREDTRG